MLQRLAVWVVATLLVVQGVAFAQANPFSDSIVQSPELRPPARGSVTGQYAGTAFGPGDVSRGSFSLPLPVAVPDERGGMLASPFPVYSPEAGISEWGVGWQSANLVIVRTRVVGDLDYATDDRTGPWGRMVRGTDGHWYPDGLRSAVRVLDSGTTLIAITPDGARWTFGGADVVTTPRGTYAWYLASVVDVLGRTTSFTYSRNASGRPFLVDVTYGGLGGEPAYDVHFSYEATRASLTDYRSSAPFVLDRRVHAITASKIGAAGALSTRWSYALAYTEDAPSPAFYLSRVQQTFASGEEPPPLVYTYGTASAYLARAAVARAPKLDALVSSYGTDVIQPNRSASFDADDDGRPDLELGYDDRLLVQTDGAFEVEALPPIGASTDPLCRRAAYSGNAPRLVARMRGNDASYSVLGTTPGVGSTGIAVCDRAGNPLYQAIAPGAWSEGPTTKLADLNRDRRPDLVTVYAGGYEVLPNTSTSSAYSFGAPIHGALTPAVDADALWVHDFDGDGIADLVARAGSSFFVWSGEGNYEYAAGRAYEVLGAIGPIPLGGYTVTWLDANGDGLADVLLQQSTSLDLFLNDGSALIETPVPAFASVDWFAGRPVALDLAGTGNPSIAFIEVGKGYTLDLAAPPVGLLATADDGRGTVLSFAYAPAPPTPGVRVRHTLLTSLSVSSTGYDAVSYGYTYAEPTLHSVGGFLVGYDQVSRRGPLETQVDTFLNGDDFAALQSTSEVLDDLEPAVAKIATTTYADVTSSFGVAWKRRLTESRGWESTGAGSPTSDVDVTEYTAYAGDVCPEATRVTSSAGVLATQTTYAAPAGLAGALACVSSHVVLTGTHPDATLDFRHEAALARNDAGQLTSLTLYDRAGNALAAQEVTYTPAGLVASVTKAGKGTATFAYLPGTPLLQSATTAEGVVTSVTSRDSVTDAVLALSTNRGGAPYVQGFAYDGQERLHAAWNNLGGASESLPDQTFAYRYASGGTPALVEVTTLLDARTKATARTAEIDAATGDALAKARLLPQGWAFGEVTHRARTTRTVSRLTKPATTADVGTLDVTSLYADAQVASSVQSSAFGVPVSRADVVQSGVVEDVTTALSAAGPVTRTDTQNGQYRTVTTTDAAQRVTSIVDAGGAKTSYTYDALGRVRRVRLADGTSHAVDYDDDGRPSRVDRAGVASIAYSYDGATGLLIRRDYLGADGSAHAGVAMRRVQYAYDSIGRVRIETDVDTASGASLSFTFYYDGATPAAPGGRTALGLLSAVTGSEYDKTLAYRADGSLASSVVSIAGWRSIETDLSYAEDGQVVGRSVVVRDGAGDVLVKDVEQDVRDAYGRIVATTRDGLAFSALGYDANGLPSTVTFGGPYAHGETASIAYDPVTREAVATSWKNGAWTANVTRAWNNRGLIAGETFAIGAFNRRRSYGYTAQGFLAQSSDADATYAYAYDATGLPADITSTIDGSTDGRVFRRSGNVLTAGAHHHTFDELGRVVGRDGVAIAYGPNGQVATAESGGKTWSYLYDETGQRIAKVEAGVPVAAYLGDGSYMDASARTAPIAFGGAVVGVLVEPMAAGGAGGAKRFQLTVTDARGSVLADANGTPRLGSPFGDRAAHPDVAAAIDYATKGWDQELGAVRMGVRDYDPALGRFLEPDPLFLEELAKAVGSPVEASLYGYAKGDPVDYRDSTGLCAEDGCVAEGTAALVVGAVFAYAALNAYVHQPAVERNLSVAIGAGRDAAAETAGEMRQWAQRAIESATASVGMYLAAKQAALATRFGGDTRYVFATYTVPLADGSVYSGRTATTEGEDESYEDAAKRAINERWDGGHHMAPLAESGMEPELDAWVGGKISTRPSMRELGQLAQNYSAIRGREQQLIDAHGGARSDGGTSGNSIRGVARENPMRRYFDAASTTIITPEFGPAD